MIKLIKALFLILTPKRPTVVRAEKRVISDEEREVLFFQKRRGTLTMEKCECRVCVLGDWIVDRYGLGVYEDWGNEGMYLEGGLRDNKTLFNRFRYWLHFQKAYIMFKYRGVADDFIF